jgi:exopolysaccharide production protein ExoY
MNRSTLTGFALGPVDRFVPRAGPRRHGANADSLPQLPRIQPARTSYRLPKPAASPSAVRLALAAAPGDTLPAWKRALDIFGCLLALPALSLLTLVMAIVSWRVSPGPVFFCQERLGYRGSRFKMLKFRTLTVSEDAAAHPNHFPRLLQTDAPTVKPDDHDAPGLIPGGWVLRASGLDELPQLINVLGGDMSLVGPRPCTPGQFAQYQYLPRQRERLNAVPGMTGLWQVSRKNPTTVEEMIRLDTCYARQVSLPLDLKIILLTPWAMAAQLWNASRRRKSRASTTVESATGGPFQESTHPAA